jgi:hypothetical protein
MNIKDILASATDLVGEVTTPEHLALLESKLKELFKDKKESFKEAVKAEVKASKEKAKSTIRGLLVAGDEGKYVKYTYGSGKDKVTRIGKLVRVPTTEHPTFSVEADDGKGGVKKLPRNATAFVGFASAEEVSAMLAAEEVSVKAVA